MTNDMPFFRFRVGRLLATALVLVLIGRPARGVEPYQAFLDSLRDRGMYDMAIEYLQQMRTSRLIPDDVKPLIPYEEGITLIAAAAAERDFELKSKQLDQARDKFKEFVRSAPDHPLVAGAESQMGNILAERAKTLLQKATRPTYAAQKDELTKQARELFAESQKVFVAAEAKYEALLKQFPKVIDPKDTKQIDARDRARLELRSARISAGRATYESSRAYPPGSPEAKKLLEAAAAKFGELYEKYRIQSTGGLLARLYQGQCYQDLGQHTKALGFYSEILAQADDPDEFRKLKARRPVPGHAVLDQRQGEEVRRGGRPGAGLAE